MILLNPRGGLCNRLRVIGSAIKLGIDYGDSIIIFWRRGQEVGCSFEELFDGIVYNSKKGDLVIKNIDYSEDELIQKIQREIGNERSYMDTIADSRKFLKDYIYNNEEIFLLSTCSEFYNFSGEYDWLFPRKEIMDKIGHVVQMFGKNCIGVHIRRTDHRISKRFSPNELFIEIMNEEIKKTNDTKFYLATDDVQAKKYFLDLFGNRIITSQYEIFNRSNKNGMISAVIDLYALSKTKKIYGSFWSSFSSTAASIGRTPLEYVCTKPIEKILNKKVVIYGAGWLGQVVYQIYSELCNIVGWIDQNYKTISNILCMKILPPNTIKELSFDYILIAVESNNAKEEIKKMLLEMNIESSIIIEEV